MPGAVLYSRQSGANTPQPAPPRFVEPTSKRCKRFELGDLIDHTIDATEPFRRLRPRTYSEATLSATDGAARHRPRRRIEGSRVSTSRAAMVTCIAAASERTIRSIAGATCRCHGAETWSSHRPARGKRKAL